VRAEVSAENLYESAIKAVDSLNALTLKSGGGEQLLEIAVDFAGVGWKERYRTYAIMGAI